MKFKLFNADGDSIWVDKVDLDKNGLLSFFLFVASITLAVAVLPDDGTTSTDTKIVFGIAAGVLGGLLAEALIDNISAAISERIETLPEGVGQGNRIR